MSRAPGNAGLLRVERKLGRTHGGESTASLRVGCLVWGPWGMGEAGFGDRDIFEVPPAPPKQSLLIFFSPLSFFFFSLQLTFRVESPPLLLKWNFYLLIHATR